MSDPRNVTVWIAARNVLDAPDPAKGFTEAEWGVLLFDNTCEVRIHLGLTPETQLKLLCPVVRCEKCTRCGLEHLEAYLQRL
jgi:hypothetical protein